MEEEYKKSLEIIKIEKEKLINQLKDENSSIDAKSKILQNIKTMDGKIEFYINKLKNGMIIKKFII